MIINKQTHYYYYMKVYKNHTHSFCYMILALCTIVFFFFVSNDISITDRLFHPYSSFIHNNYICPIQGDKWIVVTTIVYPTLAIHKFLNLTTPWNLIVIADEKTPKNWTTHLNIHTSRLLFLSIEQQAKLNFRILRYLLYGLYARKNLGYLLAIQCGAKIIFESDDDNLIETDDIYLLPKIVQPKHLPWIAFHRQRSSLVNICGSFGFPHMWLKGFPIDQLGNVTEDGWYSVRKNHDEHTYAYIQQYLADDDADVDAIRHLTQSLSSERIKFDQKQSPIGIESFTFSPYNTKNTIIYYEAFWGLYLPVTTTFRVSDIWRGYWVQRLLWDIGGRLIFGTATVKQHRNSHSKIKDMDEEYQLYHRTSSFVDFLRSWSSSHTSLSKRILQLAIDIASSGFWDTKEVDIINAWLLDLHSVGYQFPSIITPSTPSDQPVVHKRAAICVTGLAECIEEAWTPTYDTIRSRLQGDIDTFLFLSSSAERGPIPLDIRLKQIRSYMNATVTILYRDRLIDPHIPSTCKVFYDPEIPGAKIIAYHQQLWGLSECYDLVKEYEKKMNIRYELLIRARPDTVLLNVPNTLSPPDNSTIIIPDEHHYGGYNDRFAVGQISLMEKYMRRWHNISACHIQDLNAEIFLKLFLDRFGVNVQPIQNLSYAEKPHAHDQCH